MLQYSRYNYIVELEPGKSWGLINLRNLATYKLNRFSKLLYDNVLLAPDTKLAKNLQKLGFLVDYDELAHYRAMHATATGNTQSFGLTICPTLGCNFRCPYCFEEHGQGPMSEAVQVALVKMVKGYIEEYRPKSFSVTWFGGEPLLYPAIIQKLSASFLELCEEHKVEYSANIITNGYLLTPEVAAMLEASKVKTMQITLDGMQETNDKTRILADGRGSFERIISNLRALHTNIKISIRCNLSAKNKADFPNLQKLMQEIAVATGNKINVYAGHMVAFDDAPEAVANAELSYDSFLEHGLNNGDNAYAKLKKCDYHYCGADCFAGFTVDDKGYLYKCWNHVGRTEYSVGQVLDEENPWLKQTRTAFGATSLGFDVTQEPECAECILLPQCNGGCPDKRFRSKVIDHCEKPMLKILDKLVEKFFNNRKE